MYLQSVQVGKARKVLINGRIVMTAIHKTAVPGRVAVRPLGLEGDEQANLSVHGGLEKAVYAYPSEHYGFWLEQRKQAGLADMADMGGNLPWGSMGENLTLAGLLETDVWLGDVLQFPNCRLRVEQPREPCFKFNAAMGFNTAAKAMVQSGFCGFYLSVLSAGSVQSGEAFTLLAGPRRVGMGERVRQVLGVG